MDHWPSLGAAAAEIGSKVFQVVCMGILAAVSFRATPKRIHRLNESISGPSWRSPRSSSGSSGP